MPPPLTYTLPLDRPDDWRGWLAAASRLAAARVLPEAILWQEDQQQADLFGAQTPPLPQVDPASPPPEFVALARLALCHRAPTRFALLYRLLLRSLRAPDLLTNRSDADVAQANALAKAVGRDKHKMTAFVRFRETHTPESGAVFVAWFEPEHHILRLTAPFFMRRFASQRWSILTPQASAHWNGETLTYAPGARRQDAPGEDRLEDLWLTYYASIFNPARLKVKAMKSEMPVKYWRNLPEAKLIAPLIRSAEARTQAMLAHAPRLPKPLPKPRG
jgi:uracil-DNA glycosylase